MDVVSKQKKVFLTLEDLATHKSELKQEIEAKKLHISNTSKEIVSPISMIISIVSAFHKGVNILNGLQTSLKAISFIRNIFKKQ